MQLLAKIKRKNSDKSVSPTAITNPSGSTTTLEPKATKPTSPRSAFLALTKSKIPLAPQPPNTSSITPTLPDTPPPAYTASPETALQNSHVQHTGTEQRTSISQPPQPQQQRQIYRVPDVMYCPVLDKNGKGYGNEEARQSTIL